MQEIANDILGEQSPKRLFVVRGKLYELLTNCIPPELILRRLMLELVKKLDDELKHQAAQLAAFYEHRLQVIPAHPLPACIHLSDCYTAHAATSIVKYHECCLLGQNIV